MMGFTEIEVKTYMVLLLSWLSIIMVNTMEGPYSRSLVECNVPVDPNQFSGSHYCGDRLYVIEHGARINGFGQSLENFGRIIITFFVSSYSDHGRKPPAVIGEALIVASVSLFFLAGFWRSYAIVLYTVAQGLQGMSGIGLIAEIVTSDVAIQSGEKMAVLERKQFIMSVFGLGMSLFVGFFMAVELTDYRLVWFIIIILNSAILGLLIVVFPETLPEEKKRKEEPALVADAVREVKHYAELIRKHDFIRWTVVERVMLTMADPSPIIGPILMAFFGLSQSRAYFVFLPAGIVSPMFGGLLPGLCRRHTTRKTFYYSWWFDKVVTVVSAPVFFWNIFGLIPSPVFWNYFKIPNCGLGIVEGTIRLNLTGDEHNAKYQGMMQLTGFFTGSLSSAIYPLLLHTENPDWFQKYQFLMFAVTIYVCGTSFMWYNAFPVMLDQCDKLDAEAAEAEKKAAAAAEEQKTSQDEDDAKPKSEEAKKEE
mmetsp:Transcript_68214/g.163695  ORF Transcript_68214/g.163695 Transcript_68214/m.163695 type:complete len:480 (-) Transcript_68214:76-1515(-)